MGPATPFARGGGTLLAAAFVLFVVTTAAATQPPLHNPGVEPGRMHAEPVVLTLEHRPKRSAQNPYPYVPRAAHEFHPYEEASDGPLSPIAQTYGGLDCYGRWKFRGLLGSDDDDDSADSPVSATRNGTIPLCDNTAEFYTVIGVGTPPQHFYVQVDTGSSMFGVPALGCSTCAGRAADRYSRHNSTTGEAFTCADIFHCSALRCYADTSQCGFHSQYQDKSFINGVIIKEKLTFGGITFDGMFGAIYEAAGTFSLTSQVDGILGLSYFSDLSCLPNCMAPVWDSMVQASDLPDMFSLQLPDINKGVAQLVLGGTGNVKPESVNWTPIKHESYYVVDLKQIDIGGVPIEFDRADMGQVIVDSGTTLLILPRNVFEALKDGFLSGNCSILGICEHARKGYNIFNHCFEKGQFEHMTDDLNLYPTISFKFPGVQVDLSPHQYMRVQYRSTTCYELAIAPIDNTITILGDTFMRGRVTVFDRENKRIGFTNSMPYTWREPPLDDSLLAFIVCSLGGFGLIASIALAVFVYAARKYKRRRMPHYEPLHLDGRDLLLDDDDGQRDGGDDQGDYLRLSDLDFALPDRRPQREHSSQEPTTTGATPATLVNPSDFEFRSAEAAHMNSWHQ